MNHINFWIDRPPHDNILFYNAENLNQNDLHISINQTSSSIVFIYNLYISNEDKQKIIKENNMTHFFYTKNSGPETLDTGILILSYFPILIYTNKSYQKITKRIARMITFTIKHYMFKIEMNPNLESNGYNFFFIFITKNKKVAYSVKPITNKIILLKSGKSNF